MRKPDETEIKILCFRDFQMITFQFGKTMDGIGFGRDNDMETNAQSSPRSVVKAYSIENR